jgi:linoleate 10R-lipoxygenase
VLRVIEILGISQARSWGCCSLNDFRRFLGLKPYTNFEEWNPNRDVAEAARKLYRNIENLELYVGLAAEEDRTVKPGVGLCSPCPCALHLVFSEYIYISSTLDTTARAVLADAVALVRGDRYLTYDLTPFNLTTWGFTYANRNPNNAAWGGQLGRVLARALPNHYDADSVYTHFPLITPTGQPHSMDNIIQKNGYGGQYSVAPPVILPPTILVTDPVAIYDALRDDTDKKLVTPYARNILDIKLLPSFLTSIDDAHAYGSLTKSIQELFVPKSELEAIGQYFYDKTLQLLGEKSLRLNDKIPHYVDIVRDVLRLVPVHWASTQIVRFSPLCFTIMDP